MNASLLKIASTLFGICALMVMSAPLSLAALGTQNQAAAAVLGLVEEGSYHYLKGDFKAAIGPYQKALDLEKKKRVLDKTLWKVLIDNLGMAYGISGDLEKAKETFEYGISKDPDYPLFYYNMACTYGEMDDVDKAIKYLKLAFERRKNMIEGEEFPDPAADSSFKRFMENEKFQAALKELKQK